MTVLIAMPALRLPEAAPGQDARAGAPELPGLTQLLRHGRRSHIAADWRSGVMAALGGAVATVAPVAVAAHAVPHIARDAPVCFVSAVHVIAGISRMHLSPEGALRPGLQESEVWRNAFNAEFGGTDLHLHAAAPGAHWLLTAPFAHAAQDAEPALLAGEALERAPAANAAQRDLRRLGAEVEMWLAAHPLNRQRELRREAPVTALWCWGGARAVTLPALRAPRRLLSATAEDAWLAGLAAYVQRQPGQVAGWDESVGRLASVPSSRDGDIDTLIVVAADATLPPGQNWQMLERDWFEPAARALRSGALRQLRLQIGSATWQVRPRSPLSWPRRSRHWTRLLDSSPR